MPPRAYLNGPKRKPRSSEDGRHTPPLRVFFQSTSSTTYISPKTIPLSEDLCPLSNVPSPDKAPHRTIPTVPPDEALGYAQVRKSPTRVAELRAVPQPSRVERAVKAHKWLPCTEAMKLFNLAGLARCASSTIAPNYSLTLLGSILRSTSHHAS